MTANWRSALLITAGVGVAIGIAFVEPIAQDLRYHDFADQRQAFGIPNFLNVMSNLPFLLVGGMGIKFVMQNPDVLTPHMRLAWLVFFFGISLTTFGSGYYHLQPANGPLVWDRLPMTIGFMSLVAIIVAEYTSSSLGKRLLLPLLAIGLASVWYWSYTEALGRGDLRLYAAVQFVPILLVPMIIILYRTKSDLGPYLWWMIAFYVAAKLTEYYDAEIYTAGSLISGHTLKHLIAALAPASLLYGLTQRKKYR